jgi:uncharacterized damage-inducible protein DinB
MESADLFGHLFEYDYWANCEAIASLGSLKETSERVEKVLGHVIGAQRVWLARFEAPGAQPPDPWPRLPAAEAALAVDDLHRRWMALVSKLGQGGFPRDLRYRNTKGAEFSTPVEDVLLHLIIHSAYHRGQIAAAVREADGKPAATDYIVYVRQTNRP